MTERRKLWGVDHTLVMVLGFFPVWLLGVVDYCGSRVVALERCRPTAAAVSEILTRVFAEHGTPERLLSDNGPCFKALDFAVFLASAGVSHVRIRPGRPWTNGRVERLFRTFKETIFRYIWLFASVKQIDRYCADFTQFCNRDRPHSAFAGRTPDEVFFGLRQKDRPLGRVGYCDGQLDWYRFG